MATERAQMSPGMNVIGSDGNLVGQVKEIREANFLVERQGQRGVYVPFGAILDIGDYTIALNVPADQVDRQGWEQPPQMGKAA